MALWAFPTTASAAFTLCPNPIPPGDTNQYGVNPTSGSASCLAYGYGNIGQGNPLNDDFLDGGAPSNYDASAWTTVNGNLAPTSGAGTSGGGYSFAGVAGTDYALGVKDGSDPTWAVFLLPTGVYSGSWSVTGGTLSHLVLYSRPGTGTPGGGTSSGQTTVPEPASLILLGSGLSAAAVARRRRKQAVSA